MAFRTHCDWSGKYLAYEDDRAVLGVTIYHPRGKGALDAKWAEETKPTRHFCAAAKDSDVDRHGRNRMGLVPDEPEFDSCYDRAIATIKGRELSDPGMGLEWRLVAVEDKAPEPNCAEARQANYDAAKADGGAGELEQYGLEWHQTIRPLVLGGFVRVDDVAEASDEELLCLPRIGPKRLADIRRAVKWYREKATVA
jgi:hypothetical protein